MSGKRIGGGCIYNIGIDCENRVCERGGKCGWHPMIVNYRKRLIKKNQLPMAPVPEIHDEGKLNPMQKRERDRQIKNAVYAKERRDKLIAEGRCIVCGGINDREGKVKCATCWERERVQRKLREIVLDEPQ